MNAVRLGVAWMLALSVATGCGGPKPGPCPPLKTYTQAQNEQLASELERLPSDAITITVIGDYMTLRDQVRACS